MEQRSCESGSRSCRPAVRKLVPEWSAADLFGMVRVRLGFGRMSYGMAPGLYAMGNPTVESAVLVTANYKLTVDVLRRELRGRDLWILLLDTSNVNVWCAAGKGSFGTAELVRRIESSQLTDYVTHRHLILPQLGAPGVAAHELKRLTGFHVNYGPVRASDLPEFLDNDKIATARMRRVTFPLRDRLVLTPIQLRQHVLPMLALILACAVAFVSRHGWERGVWDYGVRSAVTIVACWITGSFVGPAALPWLPGRAFHVKGAWLGLTLATVLTVTGVFRDTLPILGGALWLGASVSYLMMLFTGCATYTSQSGVKMEMKALPVQATIGLIGLVLWTVDWWAR